MEIENMYFDFEPSYIGSHVTNGCSLEPACYFQNNQPIPTCCSADFLSSNDVVGTEIILELETTVLDLDFMDNEQCSSFDIVQMEACREGGVHQESAEFLAAEQSHLKEIQDELMEESSLSDLLFMGAEAIEAGNVRSASVIAMKLSDILSNHQENEDDPLDRLALYFTQGLLKKSLNSAGFREDPVLQQSTKAFQMLQELSPYVKFAHFTANQAILEATQGRQEIHVIDFDIMEGIQWPSLMVDLAVREDSSLRITAIISDKKSSTATQQTGYRLREFADSINLSFSFDQILISNEEDFEGIKVGQTLIANCMINQLHMPQRENSLVNTFFNGVKKLSPELVVLVQEELFNFSKSPSLSFVEFFCEALDHYTAISDSLRSGFCGGYQFASRIIEEEFLRMRIQDCLKQFPCKNGTQKLPTNAAYPASLVGFKPIPLSSCNVTQARHLVSLFNGGYWVQNEGCRLKLCWKSRPLTTASIWVPTAVGSRQSTLSC